MRVFVVIAIAATVFMYRQNIRSYARDAKKIMDDVRAYIGSTMNNSAQDLMSIDKVKKHINTINSEIERIRDG